MNSSNARPFLSACRFTSCRLIASVVVEPISERMYGHRGSSEAISLGSFSRPSTMPPRLRSVEWGRPSTSVGDPERFDAQAGSLDGHPFVASQQHVPRKPSTRRF